MIIELIDRFSPTMSTSASLPQPPFYTIPNISNLRDCALLPNGLRTSTGALLRPGLLFRSAEVSQLDESGWIALRSLGVAHVFDLRSKPEVEKGFRGITGSSSTTSTSPTPGTPDAPDVRRNWIEHLEAAGLQRSWVPVFEETDYSPQRLAERYAKYMDEATQGFVDAYEDILRNAGPAFSTILRYLASITPDDSTKSREAGGIGKGALVHCTAGKDRTGIFFGILFSFLGIPDRSIAEEYHLTELGLAHVRDEVVGRLMLSPGFRKYMGEAADGGAVKEDVEEKGRRAAIRMVGAREESMLESLKMVRRVWGGAEEYLRKVVGLGDGELEALKRNLLVVGREGA